MLSEEGLREELERGVVPLARDLQADFSVTLELSQETCASIPLLCGTSVKKTIFYERSHGAQLQLVTCLKFPISLD